MIARLWNFLFPKPTGFCRECGKMVIDGETQCPSCWAKGWL